MAEELMNGREVTECNWIFCLYKDPTLIPDYKHVINGEDIITDDGIFYYGLATNLAKAGYHVFDNTSIYEYLRDKPTLQKGFDERGGFGTIREITTLINTDNIDIYYDNLNKSNMLIRLNKAGFDVITKLDKLKQMTCEEIYDYYEYQLANIMVDKIEKIKMENLSDGYDEEIAEWDKGGDVGYRIGSKMLNHQLLGVHKKNLMLHLAGIGQGKTSAAIAWYILPVLETDDVCIIANEQDEVAWRKMILSTVLFSKIGKVDGFSRHKLSVGGYTDDQKDKLREAARWLNSQKGKINFVDADYNINTIKKIITRQSKLGTGLFILDTMKPMNDASDRAWGEFSEMAKELFLLSKHCDIAIVATAQLSSDAMARKFLDLTCIGKARSIAETANSVVMFRSITDDEKDKIKGFTYENKIKREVTLDKDKEYIVVYTPKNRYGQVSPQIIMERNLNFNTYKDVCWWNCPYDNYRR